MEPTEALVEAGLEPASVLDLVDRAIAEDLDGGVDVTSVATVSPEARGTLDLVARAAGVIAGAPVAAAALVRASEGRVTCTWIGDGTRVSPGDVVVSATGPTRDLLLGERTALNLLCHLSGGAPPPPPG
ncbi:MAG: nicotinate-nucleotide diphosphorylase (carboxylating), partial [Candidatus Nanopelagicales bacterium]